MTAIESVDLREKVPRIGTVRLLRAEWKEANARFVLVWYEVGNVQQPFALRLDLDKRTFLDDLDDRSIDRAVKEQAQNVFLAVAARRRERWRESLLREAG